MVNFDLHTLSMMASLNPLDVMGRNFRGEHAELHSSDFIGMAVLLTVVAATCYILWRFLAREESDKPYYKPRRLFRELCDVHQLDTATRALLSDLARAHGMSQPAMLFLQRERFHTDRLSADWKSRKKQLDALAIQLFATPPADPPAAKPST